MPYKGSFWGWRFGRGKRFCHQIFPCHSQPGWQATPVLHLHHHAQRLCLLDAKEGPCRTARTWSRWQPSRRQTIKKSSLKTNMFTTLRRSMKILGYTFHAWKLTKLDPTFETLRICIAWFFIRRWWLFARRSTTRRLGRIFGSVAHP